MKTRQLVSTYNDTGNDEDDNGDDDEEMVMERMVKQTVFVNRENAQS